MSLSSIIDDELINPLKRLRLTEIRKAPDQVAKEAGLNPAAIHQAEAGFYVNPLPAYLQYLRIVPGSTEFYEITEEYHEYQAEKRRNNGANGKQLLIINPVFSLTEHPLYTWRRQSGLNVYGFCSAFCVHMPTVNNFEKNITSIVKLPPTNIANPLLVAGYDLTEFAEACQVYKETVLTNQRNLNNLPPVGSTLELNLP